MGMDRPALLGSSMSFLQRLYGFNNPSGSRRRGNTSSMWTHADACEYVPTYGSACADKFAVPAASLDLKVLHSAQTMH